MMNEFQQFRAQIIRELLDSEPIHTGSWQRIDTSASPAHATYELTDFVVRVQCPPTIDDLQAALMPDLPWAETHFQERIGGEPLNPPPSHEIWPHGKYNARHLDGGKFSHSYPERFWPRYTGGHNMNDLPDGEYTTVDGKLYRSRGTHPYGPPIDISGFPKTERMGVRFRYGDLQDVIDLLVRERLTRQAFLPIWFPEDTGVHHGQRVPCTLGYHFLVRENFLSMRYYMRSCDMYRHFTNDVYMAARLMQHVIQQVNLRAGFDDDPIRASQLIMYITSLHGFVGDKDKLEAML